LCRVRKKKQKLDLNNSELTDDSLVIESEPTTTMSESNSPAESFVFEEHIDEGVPIPALTMAYLNGKQTLLIIFKQF